jgi:hypothetical protein
MEENAVVIMVSSGVRLSEVRSISSVLVEVEEEWRSTTDDDDRDDRVDAALLLTGGGDQAEAPPPRPLPW